MCGCVFSKMELLLSSRTDPVHHQVSGIRRTYKDPERKTVFEVHLLWSWFL